MSDKFQNLSQKATKQLLTSLFDNSLNGIMSFKSVRDNENRIIDFEWLFINEKAEEVIEMTAEFLQGKRLLEIIPGSREAGLFDKYANVVESGEIDVFEQYYPSGKTERWFKVSVVKLEDGLTATFQDVTELKEVVLQVGTKEKRYKKLFKESLDPILLLSENYKIEEANSSFLKLFSYELEDISNLNFQQLFENEFDFNECSENLIQNKEIKELEVSFINKKNQIKICLINCIKVLKKEGEFEYYFCVIRDLAQRKFTDRKTLIAEKLSLTGKLARAIAHEIRNPLTNMSLAVEQLKDEVPAEMEDAELYFTIIKRNTDRISKLISDLLNSSKPKELILVKQPFNALVQQALTLVTEKLNLLNIGLKESYAKDLPDLPLDSDQIKVAYLNLFMNAIEAMKPETGVLMVSTFYEEDNIKLIIEDNGKGISEDNLKKLFEPFFTFKKEGSGLGLTTVQNVIQSHGGHIQVVSEVKKGTTFQLNFPTDYQ